MKTRSHKKSNIGGAAPQAFTQEYLELVPDSDNSFGDALRLQTAISN
ncbi:hypothetical protein OK016_28985 [Vibrio chagasii]|nr:hypothetical protein [Vibrio chagasii]